MCCGKISVKLVGSEMQTRRTRSHAERDTLCLTSGLAAPTVMSAFKFLEFNSSTPPSSPPLVFAKEVAYNVSDNP